MKSPNPMEVELKLALAPTGPAALTQHPYLASHAAHKQSLTNTYFDTPQGDLAKARIALRLRQVDGQVLQTVKTAGQGGGGLSQREEWEWQVAGPQLDLASIAKLPPFQGELSGVLDALVPQLSTDFTRHSWQLKEGVQGQESHIELVLDEGEIISGGYRTPIREAELELKGGEPEALWALALTLAEQVPLRPSDSSKAARGNALSTRHWPLPEAHSPAEWLHRATLALDAYHDSQQASFLNDAQQALATLAEHPELDATARAYAQALPGALDAHGQPKEAYGKAALALAHRLAYQTALR
ncbi:CYTH domain-containing protein [Halomonas sp. FeN2]|uniref:CYTH domain-containing protein n=1 Tax=Halomonadaceae TaxID=28256 RepID=UPI000C49FC58|nr:MULTISPECIES: CYTH domain-containing protein [Halomonas]MBF56129.1 adenylate cyclase [Halomonas sp.]MBS3669889.1 CYTH domain-containing protein [Halomonas boliviensis]UBR48737.1 CYTH domain-containing protein [Halomonas sp. FeN2]